MAVFENEKQTLQGSEYYAHLNRNWDNGNKQFDAMNARINAKAENSAPGEVIQARIDANGNVYKSLAGRLDANQKVAENARDAVEDIDYRMKTAIEDKIAQMDNSVHAYTNIAKIKEIYPNGANGIYIATDTGHQWYYIDGMWQDAGVYQAAGLSNEVQTKLDTFQTRNLIKKAESLDGWTTFGDVKLVEGNGFKGQSSLKLINVSGGGIYSNPISISGGGILSCGMMKRFIVDNQSTNARLELSFYKKETDAYGQAFAAETVDYNLNPDNLKMWRKSAKGGIDIPTEAKYVRVVIRFTEKDNSILEFAQPTLVSGPVIGPLSIDDIVSGDDGNLFTDKDFTSLETVRSNGVSVDGNLLTHRNLKVLIARATDIDEEHNIILSPIEINTYVLSLYQEFALEGSNFFEIKLIFYGDRTPSGLTNQVGTVNKKIEVENISYTAKSWNNISVPSETKFVEIRYNIPKNSNLYLFRPIVKPTENISVLPENMAMVKPKNLNFVNPTYSIGGSGRKYIWIKFDKLVIDYYTDKIEIDWDYWSEGGTYTNNDNFEEGTYWLDVGPQATNIENGLYYNTKTRNLVITKTKNVLVFSIPILCWDKERGFYGLFIDQANKSALEKRDQWGFFKNELTIEMLSEIARKEQDVLNEIEDGDFTVGLMADNHRIVYGDDDARVTPAGGYTDLAFAKVMKDLSVDANWNLGDSVRTTPNGKINTSALISAFKYIPAEAWVYCEGNHDRNIIKPILCKKMFNNIVNRAHRFDENFVYGESGSYFYVNYKEPKIRVIVLDCYDITEKHDDEYAFKAGYRQNQLKWLVDKALRVDDGWKVVILTHQIPAYGFPENMTVINADKLIQILESFVNGTSIHITAEDTVFNDGTFTLDLQTNFTKKGTIIAVLAGHNHVDYQTKLSGINYVTTECGYIDIVLYHGRDNQPAKYGQRNLYDYSGICFDVLIFKAKQRKVVFKRFGHGKDREITY